MWREEGGWKPDFVTQEPNAKKVLNDFYSVLIASTTDSIEKKTCFFRIILGTWMDDIKQREWGDIRKINIG